MMNDMIESARAYMSRGFDGDNLVQKMTDAYFGATCSSIAEAIRRARTEKSPEGYETQQWNAIHNTGNQGDWKRPQEKENQ